jgi:hypothetical protein
VIFLEQDAFGRIYAAAFFFSFFPFAGLDVSAPDNTDAGVGAGKTLCAGGSELGTVRDGEAFLVLVASIESSLVSILGCSLEAAASTWEALQEEKSAEPRSEEHWKALETF